MEDTNVNVNPKCTACKCYWKPDETDVKSSGLVYNTCKRCRDISKVRSNKYKEANPDKVKQQQQRYRQENADKLKQQQQKYRQENADKVKQQSQKYRQDNAEIINQRRRKDYQDNTDKFKQQQQKYRQENGDKIKQQKQKYYQENADKLKQQKQKYYQENADKLKQQKQKYYQENADKIKQYIQKYHQDNADKVKQQRQKYYQENKCEHNKAYGTCSKCNTPLYLLNIQRMNLRRCLKIANLDKTKPTIEYLGCDAVYFKDYIQKKMDIYNETADIKMDFTNIHIDHIKPISSFNLDDENDFLNCSHYTNFQPLLAKDNLTKSNKWNDEDDAYWNDNIRGNDEYLQIYIN